MSSRVKYPIVYGPSTDPSAAMCAGSQLSILPPFQAACWTSHAWLVEGIAWAEVILVLSR